MALEFRGSIAKTYENWFSTPRGRLADRLEKKIISDLVKVRPGDKILDVGCGTGHFSVFFKSLGAEVAGLDPSAEMLEQAPSLYRDKEVKFMEGSAYRLPFPDRSFDLVTMITVLELLEEPKKAIEEAFRVSKGKVFLGILNRDSLLARQRKKEGKKIWQQVRFFTLPEVRGLLGKEVGVRWKGSLYLPLLNTEKGFSFRLGLETQLSDLKLPYGGFIGILANKEA